MNNNECVWTRIYYPFLGMGYYSTDCGYGYEGGSTNPVLTTETAPQTCPYSDKTVVLNPHTTIR